jgi:lysophospholipase L1-like esterase
VTGFLRNIYDNPDLMTMDDMHPSREGYRQIALTVYAELKDWLNSL